MKILYFIPARGGSKGLPGKNIRPLHHKPLIAYSIEAALQCAHLGVVMVNTDDPQIAEVAKTFGAEVPFLRPAELATDSAATLDVLEHTLEYYKQQGQEFDLVVVLQPTSPLRTSQDIDAAIELMEQKHAEAIVSVCENEHHPLWSNSLPPDGSMRDFMRKEVKGKNRQQLPPSYRLNGALYISSPAAILKHKGFLHNGTYAYIMPAERSVDIDHLIDFQLAEILLKNN